LRISKDEVTVIMEKRPSLLVVDDEQDFVQTIGEILIRFEYDVQTSNSGFEALQMLSLQSYDVVLLDLSMSLISGIDTLKRMHKIDQSLPVIILTADDRVGSVVEAMKVGAYDYLSKPLELKKLETTIKNALLTRELRSEVVSSGSQFKSKYGLAQIIGKSEKIQDVLRAFERVANTDVTVSIRGESGVGKEHFARAIHFNSQRKRGPFVAVNCAAIPENLLENELFGHEKGSLNGVATRREGKFEQANGGSIFLNEIGELPLSIQGKILQVFQERRFQRVGSSEMVELDVRVISATSKNLEEQMAQGRFREDLYYRISVYPLVLPPLRKRKVDIPLLAAFFKEKFNKEYRHKVKGIQPQTMDYLMDYDWPGNIRELENILEHSFLNAGGNVLTPEHLPITITSGLDNSDCIDEKLGLKKVVFLNKRIVPLKEVEREVLMHALQLTNFNMSTAANQLGIGRTTLYRKLEKYRINHNK